MWKVVTSSNLNPPLKLFFYSPILTNNNLLLKIYCGNIVIVFFNQDFLFFILFFFLPFNFHPHFISFFLFSFFFFLSSTQDTQHPFFLFSFSPLKNIPDFPVLHITERERERDRLGPPPHASPPLLQPLLQHLHCRSSSSPPIGLGQIGLFFFSFFFSFFFFHICLF